MPPTSQDRMRDILDAISEIDDILQAQDFFRFEADRRMRLLIERLLEIICEAARRLPDDVKRDAPEIEWQKMIDFGNHLRHAYHATDEKRVWAIIQQHLPPLKAFVIRVSQSSDF